MRCRGTGGFLASREEEEARREGDGRKSCRKADDTKTWW